MPNYPLGTVPPTGEVSPGNPMPVSSYITSTGSATINVTTAGTSVLIPSTATNAIYVTGLVISNGLTAGSVYMGSAPGVVAPTTTAILIQPIYLATNGNLPWGGFQPIKVPAGNNFVVTAVSCTTLSVVATYYVAP